jgi:hypothetical protein
MKKTPEWILISYREGELSLDEATAAIQELIKPKKSISPEVVDKFEKIWNLYPKRVGKKEALRHFAATVKTDQDYTDIQKALENYKKTKNVIEGKLEYIQNGSRWFNNWRDWLDASLTRTKKEPQSAIEKLKELNLT